MGAFAYLAPKTLVEAMAALAGATENSGRAQVLAGGTDLLVQLRTVDRAPRTIVDIKGLPETNRLEIGREHTFIGAAISSAVLNENGKLKSMFPGLLEAADLIGSTQIQGRATLGGNLCNASPAGDSIPAMIASEAVCVIAGPGGERELPVEAFVTGVGKNALEKGELLLGLRLANPGPGTGDAYLRFIPRTEMDIAVAGCGVRLVLDDSGVCTAARVSIGAVAPTALLVTAAANALIGTKVDEEALAAAGRACSAASSPITDKRGTVDYRRKIVAVLCRRAGALARDRALAGR
ncbi:MAG TPA: FAD binding domain-containing protein [Pseudomonadales bacterium]